VVNSLLILIAAEDFVVQPKCDNEPKLPGTAAHFQPQLKTEQFSQTSGM